VCRLVQQLKLCSVHVLAGLPATLTRVPRFLSQYECCGYQHENGKRPTHSELAAGHSRVPCDLKLAHLHKSTVANWCTNLFNPALSSELCRSGYTLMGKIQYQQLSLCLDPFWRAIIVSETAVPVQNKTTQFHAFTSLLDVIYEALMRWVNHGRSSTFVASITLNNFQANFSNMLLRFKSFGLCTQIQVKTAYQLFSISSLTPKDDNKKLCAVKEEHNGAAYHVAHATGIQADNSQYPNLVTPSKPDNRTHYYYSAYINRTQNIKLTEVSRPLIASAKRRAVWYKPPSLPNATAQNDCY
jgi:hypothetical protein